MDLREYEQHKFTIAEILRGISNLTSTDRRDWQDRIRNLFERLADDRFNLVVVGRFNRGKTSLMNAIMATNRLPTDVVPLTSVITTVSYGTRERVVLKYDERILTREIPIEALTQFITQLGNPGNIQRVRVAEVQIPAEILRRGFYFVDTPGLGSVILENTLTTQSFLPEADAFLLVTSHESPLSEEEVRFFKATSTWGRRIFVVLNKQDTVSIDEREHVLAFVSQQLRAFFGDAPPKLFSLSALHGLQAKQSQNDELLEASGIPAFEQHLTEFLLTEKSSQFLTAMCNRLTALLHEFPRSAEAAGLLTKTEEVAHGLRGNARMVPARIPAMPVPKFSGLHQAGTCEICAEVHEQIWNFISKYQYELVVSHEAQQNFAKRGGFCPFHTWEYESIASPYGTCNGYPALLDRLAAGLRAAASAAESNQGLLLNAMKGLQPSDADCSLCEVRDKAEKEAIELLAGRVSKDSGLLNSISALCLPHLLMLSTRLQSTTTIRQLMERQAQLLQRISEDLRRNALKQDAVRRYLASEEETSAAQRALLVVAGRRNVNFDCESRLSDALESIKCEAL